MRSMFRGYACHDYLCMQLVIAMEIHQIQFIKLLPIGYIFLSFSPERINDAQKVKSEDACTHMQDPFGTP